MKEKPSIPIPLLFIFEGILILLEVPSWFDLFAPRGFEIDQTFLSMVKTKYIFDDIGTALFIPMIAGAVLTLLYCLTYLYGRSEKVTGILLVIHMLVSAALGIFFPMDRYLETPVVDRVTANGYVRGTGSDAKTAITVKSRQPDFPVYIKIDILSKDAYGREFYIIKLGDSVYKAYDPIIYSYQAG